MDKTSIAEIVFAVAAVLAGCSVVAAIADRATTRVLAPLATGIAAAAIALWVLFALSPHATLAVCAVGTTLCALTTLAAIRIRSLAERVQAVDRQLDEALERFSTVIERESNERSAELERTLARARADSASLLAEQERRIGADRRDEAQAREREAAAAFAEALASAQRHVESRFRSWGDDLDRQQGAVADGLAQLAQRQNQLISEAEARIAANAERLESESEEQRQGLLRLRDELARVIQETVTAGNAELENYASERRRTLHELNERMRRRERALSEQIEREETEATRRIQAAFADVERRQVEQLDRQLARATSSYTDAATQQFADAIRASREDAATRLSRELDRAVQAYGREAERVLAERLGHVGDAGAQRLEKRLNQIAAGLDRQRAEAIAAFEERLALAEVELRRRIEAIISEAEADRAVLEARLHDLARRVEEATARV
ncbi:MAG TPA: hypothetical protein VEH52_12375 [Gaiellaceae bacterium]|nr:hypothetical protein [Gaiellaceae bacterium]